ncbi:MAG: hypothetical protein WEC59_05545 [Salibacteraceae bacterium]
MTLITRIIISSLIILFLFNGCSKKNQYETFSIYFDEEIGSWAPGALNIDEHHMTIVSPPMKIDRIYRSMQGPFEYNEFNIPTDDDLIWLVGYKGSLIGQEGSVSESFMCHNNLDILNKDKNPWRIKTLGSSTRIFTLTQGQCEIHLPEGFGIPLPANARFQMLSQVLNHNEASIEMDVQHKIDIIYKEQSEISEPMVPLYQQAVFVTKQLSGPSGAYGTPTNETYPTIEKPGMAQCVTNCEIDYSGEYNPYQDKFGRTYSGHWNIPVKEEVIHTNVTQMMNLEYDTKIHFISLHVHPFATSLELLDKTTGMTLYKGFSENFENVIGLSKIDYFRSKEGLAVYKDHEYELISTYSCTDTLSQHTAMATMFLYLRDR